MRKIIIVLSFIITYSHTWAVDNIAYYPRYQAVENISDLYHYGFINLEKLSKNNSSILYDLINLTDNQIDNLQKANDRLLTLDFQLQNLTTKQKESFKEMDFINYKGMKIYGRFLKIDSLPDFPLAFESSEKDIRKNIKCVIKKDKKLIDESISLAKQLQRLLNILKESKTVQNHYNAHLKEIKDLLILLEVQHSDSVDNSNNC